METNAAIILGVVVMFALLAIVMLFVRKRSADRLRLRFGPEYERIVEAAGGKHKAHAELHRRQKRVRGFAIKALTADEREHYLLLWREVQSQFLDDPTAAVAGADQLLAEIVTHLGYPAGDFEQRSADLSVDHPVAVQRYRAAHDMVVRDAADEANTEGLRQAVLCYRVLFRELVGHPEADAPVIDNLSEGAIAPADEATTIESTPTEATPAAQGMVDEPEPAVQPVDEKRANVPEPVNT